MGANKEGPCQLEEAAHNQLHRGGCIEKTTGMVQSPFTTLHFHLMTPYILSLGSVQLHRISELSVAACNFKMFSMQCEDKRHVRLGGPFFTNPVHSIVSLWVFSYPLILNTGDSQPFILRTTEIPGPEVLWGVKWHQNNWFDELSSPDKLSTKQTGQATNSAPFIFNYSLLAARLDKITPNKKMVGRIMWRNNARL